MLPITAITKFTLQDYPGHTACVIWCGGCNFRCPYCHNPEFISGKFKTIDEQTILDFLETRKGKLDGVVFSGGECTLSDNIFDFIERVKKMGFLVKIDTNGSNYAKVKKMVDKKLIDFIALDIKAPKHKFKLISKSDRYEDFSKTLDLLCKTKIKSEVRTTIHTDLIQEEDVNEIIKDLESRGFKDIYYIQNFKNDNCATLDNLRRQRRILDRNKLIKPKGFQLKFRNFW